MSFERIKRLFRREETSAEAVAQGEEPVATPPPGSRDPDRETSTNAQVEGASGEPWSGDG